MNLEPGAAYASLVSVPSTGCPLFLRVAPGNPATSYVMFKIDGPPQPCFSGTQMPSGGQPPLAAEERDAIFGWISQGAPNN